MTQDPTLAPHFLQPLWDLGAAAVQAAAVDAALDTGLLDALVEPQSAEQAAAACGLDRRATGLVLDLLWSLGLCTRAGPAPHAYALVAEARRYLTRDAAESCADALRFRLRTLQDAAARLPAQLRQGVQGAQGAPEDARGPVAARWAAAARAQIAQEQRAVSVPAALAALARVPALASARHLLDLGGGPGHVAIALARAHPAMNVTVFDGPATARVAAENIAQAGLGGRMQTRGGDLEQDDIGSGYDVIWCSSVLHFLHDRAAALRKIRAALRPGGVFVAAHAEVAAEARDALRTQSFYLPMRLEGRHVALAGETAQALGAAGFTLLQAFTVAGFPMAPLQVVVAVRPEAGAAA